MKGHAKVIEVLNEILTGELTAINQYFLHAKMLKHWGYNKLADLEYKQSIGEMKHADTLIERILFLEGLPNLQRLGRLQIGESVEEMIQADMNVEVEAVAVLQRALKICQDHKDTVTEELVTAILVDEEGHIAWAETQQKLIKALGLPVYLSQQV